MDEMKKLIELVEAMSRKDFQKKIVRDVAMTPAFSRVMSLGVDALSEADKVQLQADLTEAGIPVKNTDEVQLAAIAIADRVGKLR